MSTTGFHMVLPFVVALIKNEKGQILIGRHPNLERKPYPGVWDLPGGKLKEHETPEEGIIREIKEELGYDIVSLKLIDAYHHSGLSIRSDCTSRISGLGLCYEAVVTGNLVSTEQEDVHFADLCDIKRLNLTPWCEYFLNKT